ncbi:MAG TPA: dienelactone hydrolase family protein [Acidobacteriaceae bacterium]|nr:dienelactone hydrolase family protein [Acidobacteriaceae bacterium]
MSKTVKLEASDGHQLDAYVATPQGDPIAGLVVVQEIFGVNAHIQAVTDGFARQGFYAVAPAIFDRVEKRVEIGYDAADMQKGMSLAQKLDIGNAVKDVDAALGYAKKQTGKPAMVVGYCFGGTLAWLSAARLSPAAAVGYYGGQIAKFTAEEPHCPVMLHFGRQDSHISASDVESVRKAHPEVEIYLYDAGHAFNRNIGNSYNPEAAALAFERTLEFFHKVLAGGASGKAPK